MFDILSDKLGSVVRGLRGRATITEANIDSVLREIKFALLEADVNYRVVKEFLSSVKTKALGSVVRSGITPGQEFTRILSEELCEVLGGSGSALELKGSPAVVMLVGLQGSGKTTTTAKLARLLKGRGRNPYVVPADLKRPAAVEQLVRLCRAAGVDCFDVTGLDDARSVCREALRVARIKGYDTMLVDTAGRLHADARLMDELKALSALLAPSEVLLVADAMTGQDAVNSAAGFNEGVGITGVVLTKLDSDARGGAALSMRMATGSPIKFAGIGEKLGDIEPFHPERAAGRILGMGDILTLVEKAGEATDKAEAKRLARKIKKDAFTLQDLKDQLKVMKRIGSLDGILSMVPGFDALKKARGLEVDDREITRVEAIIDSMTIGERTNPSVLNARRRQRIAKGSGTTVQDVNRLIKRFQQMRKLMKKLGSGGAGLQALLQGPR